MIEVKVPATSANVGPGFDCMGIALDSYAVFRFEKQERLTITGCDPKWQNEQNLVYQGFQKVMTHCGKVCNGLSIDIDAADIPQARGLGSSAVCIVAGAVAANAFLNNRFSKAELLDLCTELEGHPDNVAPAIYGALCVSFLQDGHVHTMRYQMDSDWKFCAIIPDYEILTKKARAVLPNQLSYQDAIFNIGHCAALAKALEIGDADMVAAACDDRLHQPYRKSLFPQYEEIDTLCQIYEMCTMYISGSGSTMMAICKDQAKGKALLDAINQKFPNWKTLLLSADMQGAVVEEVA